MKYHIKETNRQVIYQNIREEKGLPTKHEKKSIEQKGCRAVIPPRKNRKNPRDYDKDTYKERHLIECLFWKIKYFRRIFSTFDKTA